MRESRGCAIWIGCEDDERRRIERILRTAQLADAVLWAGDMGELVYRYSCAAWQIISLCLSFLLIQLTTLALTCCTFTHRVVFLQTLVRVIFILHFYLFTHLIVTLLAVTLRVSRLTQDWCTLIILDKH